MIKLIVLLVLPFIVIRSFGHTVSYDDFKSVIPLMQQEDYKDAFKETSRLLKSSKNDTYDLHGVVAYMNILSSAGMVNLGEMTYNDFIKNANHLVGQKLVMAAHPCIDSSQHGFNSVQFIWHDGQLEGFTDATNQKATSILCFEYYKFTKTINPADFIGKTVRCGGILESVETNPNKSVMWISRLHIKNYFVRIWAPR